MQGICLPGAEGENTQERAPSHESHFLRRSDCAPQASSLHLEAERLELKADR